MHLKFLSHSCFLPPTYLLSVPSNFKRHIVLNIESFELRLTAYVPHCAFGACPWTHLILKSVLALLSQIVTCDRPGAKKDIVFCPISFKGYVQLYRCKNRCKKVQLYRCNFIGASNFMFNVLKVLLQYTTLHKNLYY